MSRTRRAVALACTVMALAAPTAEAVPVDGAASASAAAERVWSEAVQRYIDDWGVSPAEANFMLAVDLDRWHHPNPDVDRWFWHLAFHRIPIGDWKRWACRIQRESNGRWDVVVIDRDDYSIGPLQLNLRGRLWSRFNRDLAELQPDAPAPTSRQAVVDVLLGNVDIYFEMVARLYERAGHRPWSGSRC